MCGFAGAISYDPRKPLAAAAADRVAELYLEGLAHRGPDGQGLFVDGLDADPSAETPAVVLAHRRLAVIDPRPRSGQPFQSPDGRLILAFNGEIFNYRQLRAELDYDWETDSDTEVLLAAYEAWGERCVERFEGMFAFAIWDRREATPVLLLARDPAGEKPLYVAQGGGDRDGTILFSSELRPLRRVANLLGWADLSLDGDALREYLAWGYVPGDLTIHAGVAKVPPGTTLTIGPGGEAVQRRYFDAGGRFEARGFGRYESPLTRTRSLVQRAVEKRLVSDVPIGCLLSGGIDSSIVALHMRRALGPSVQTFCVGFDGPNGRRGGIYDESRHAAEVASHLGCRHHEFRISPDSFDVAEDMRRLAAVYGEPFGDASALPTRLLAERVRDHVTVALGGDGGDECFGGYERYRALLWAERAARMPWADLVAEFAGGPGRRLTGRLNEKRRIRRVMRLLATLDDAPGERYSKWIRVFSRDAIRRLLPPAGGVLGAGVLGRDDQGRVGGRWFDGFATAGGRCEGRGLAAAAAAIDRCTYLPGDLLAKVDRASMLHNLEVRSPMVDADLLRFAATLCDDDLIDGHGGKRLLREAFSNHLPRSVFARRKQGFAFPISDWLRGPLLPMARDLLLSDESIAATYFERGYIRTMLHEHGEARQDHGHRLYALMMLELWWRDAREDVA